MAKAGQLIHTGETSRETLGVGGIINPVHGGGLKRKVEEVVANRDESGRLKKTNSQESGMLNPGFLHPSEGEKKA